MQGGGVAGCHVHLKMMDHAGDDGADGVRALRPGMHTQDTSGRDQQI